MKRFALAFALLTFPAQAGGANCDALREMARAHVAAAGEIANSQVSLLSIGVALHAVGQSTASEEVFKSSQAVSSAMDDVLSASRTVLMNAGCMND